MKKKHSPNQPQRDFQKQRDLQCQQDSQKHAHQNAANQNIAGQSIADQVSGILCWGVVGAIVVYCFGFLMVGFEPFEASPEAVSFPRGKFFLMLFDPGLFKLLWFGDQITFSFVQAWEVIAPTCVLPVAALGIGHLILRLLRIEKHLTFCESFVFASATGLSFFSTLLLIFGLLGWYVFFGKIFLIGLAVVGVICWCCFYWAWRLNFSNNGPQKKNCDPFSTLPAASAQESPAKKGKFDSAVNIDVNAGNTRNSRKSFSVPNVFASGRLFDKNNWLIWLSIPSLLMLFFGGMLPPVEYDVTSYHIPGAKHFFETGQISFVANNIYTNMPFDAEMFYVWGMLLTDQWYLGALVGKLTIAYCTFLAAIGLYAFGHRLHSKRAGQIMFLLYVSIPWVSWTSTAGLIDCVFGMYVLLAVFAMYLYLQPQWSKLSHPYAIEKNTAQNNSAPDQSEGFSQAKKPRVAMHNELAAGNSKRHYNADESSDNKTSEKIEISQRTQTAMIALVGVMAGSAAACKYTAVPFLVLPLGVFAIFIGYKKTRSIKKTVGLCTCFALGVLLAGGLWYAKNYCETGNPTYPLMHRLFGDSTGTWDMSKNERWSRVHSSHDFSGATFCRDFGRALLGSPWLAPAIVPLAFLPFLRRKQDRVLLVLLLYVMFYMMCWWLMTHRLDRFWVPLLPIVVIFAGLGAACSYKKMWGNFVVLLLVFNTIYTFFPNAICAPGKYSRFGFGVEAARVDPERVKPMVLYFNAHPPTGKLLLIGDADVFDYNIPVLYNTCFDDTIFDEIVADAVQKDKKSEHELVLRSPQEMRQRFRAHGVSTIVVNWSEIARFRSPGNYGYTSELVQPELFEKLIRDGVLRLQPAISTESQHVYEVMP